MASSARRDPLRELTLLVRAPEPGSSNLGGFLADHASDLAQVLDLPVDKLEATRASADEELAPHVRRYLERARDQNVQQDLERRRQRSLEAAGRLGASATWSELGAELDVDLLLGELLADRTKRWVAFTTDQGVATIIPRHLLGGTAPLRRIHLDLAAWVDPQGLHFRWKGGRAGYNWRSSEVHPSLADRVLTVPLRPQAVFVQPERRATGAWMGSIVEELGFV